MEKVRYSYAAILFQAFLLLALLSYAYYPFLSPTRIGLEVLPVDPRDLLRGNYVRLNYGISNLPTSLFKGDLASLKSNDRVYVSLDENSMASAVSAERPGSGIFLKGKLRYRYVPGDLLIDYGLEGFFTSEAEAKHLEGLVRTKTVIAEVVVASNGESRIVELKEGTTLNTQEDLPQMP